MRCSVCCGSMCSVPGHSSADDMTCKRRMSCGADLESLQCTRRYDQFNLSLDPVTARTFHDSTLPQEPAKVRILSAMTLMTQPSVTASLAVCGWHTPTLPISPIDTLCLGSVLQTAHFCRCACSVCATCMLHCGTNRGMRRHLHRDRCYSNVADVPLLPLLSRSMCGPKFCSMQISTELQVRCAPVWSVPREAVEHWGLQPFST